MPFSLAKIVRSVLAVALGLWVAGAGCLLGCDGMMTAMASEAGAAPHHATSDLKLIVSGEACASAKSHDCCSKRNERAQVRRQASEKPFATLFETEPSASEMSACPLALSRTAEAARKSDGQTDSATIVARANLFALNLPEQSDPLVAQVRLPNRGHTYLRCCSLLI